MSAGPSFLQAHQATLTPDEHGWSLVYPIAALTVTDRDQESIDAQIPIVAGSYEDALEIVRLVLRTHKPPDVVSRRPGGWHQHQSPQTAPAWRYTSVV
jgi:hypothetical protein